MVAIAQKKKNFMVTLKESISQREVYDMIQAQDPKEAIKLAAKKYLFKTHQIISIVPSRDRVNKR